MKYHVKILDTFVDTKNDCSYVGEDLFILVNVLYDYSYQRGVIILKLRNRSN